MWCVCVCVWRCVYTDELKIQKFKKKKRFVKAQKKAREAGDLDGQIVALERALAIYPSNIRVADKLTKLRGKRAKAQSRREVERLDAMAAQLEQLALGNTTTMMMMEPPIAEKSIVSKATTRTTTTTTPVVTETTTTSHQDSAEEEEVVSVDGWTRRAGSKMYKLDEDRFRLPAEVFDKLFAYQRDGVKWLWSLHRSKLGGVFADDMGLGKTVQVAAFLRGLFASEEVETVLVVLPKAVVENWRKELKEWTRRRIRVYDGTKAQREQSLSDIAQCGGILLTTYGMVRSNVDKLVALENPESGAFEPWDYVILDEAHQIKNSATEGAKSVKQIGATHRIVLTGTPILNRLDELWALFDFVQPGLLGGKAEFRKNYDDPIVRASHRNAKEVHKQIGQSTLSKLKTLIQPHFLRRTKGEVFAPHQEGADTSSSSSSGALGATTAAVDAPLEKHRLTVRKNDFIVWVSLSEVQLELYQRFLYMPEVKEILNSTKSPLAAITVLKKICQHPRLLRADMKTLRETSDLSSLAAVVTATDESKDDDTAPLEKPVHHLLERIASDQEDVAAQSGKLSFLMKLVQELLETRHRVLVFSQWQKMLDIIGMVMKEKRWDYFRIDGKMNKTEDRQDLIERFNAGGPGCPNIFLLTTQVGGLGLTLTGADRAIIFDPSWNPLDDQAVDRIYRIGQQRNCVVYRLITCGTVEEKIYRKQVFKGGLSRMVTHGGTSSAGEQSTLADFGFRYFTKEELRALFTLEDPFSSATQQQLEAKHSSRRVTDAELDEHLEFLGTISNMHGVSDHDLLFDGKGVETQEGETAALTQQPTIVKASSLKASQEHSSMDDEPRNLRQQTPEHYLEDDDVQLFDSPVATSVVPASMSTKKKKSAASASLSWELYNSHVLAARKLEQKGDASSALQKYQEAMKVDASCPLLKQKVAFLSSVKPVAAASTIQEQDSDDDGGGDGDVTLFDRAHDNTESQQPVRSNDGGGGADDDDDDDVRLFDKDDDGTQSGSHNTAPCDDDVQLFDDESQCPPAGLNEALLESRLELSPDLARPPNLNAASKECGVCWQRSRCAAFVPCGHVICCAPCAKQCKACPVCRSHIQSSLQIYLA